MTYTYPYTKAQLSWKREEGGVRTPISTLDLALATVYMMDALRDEDITIPEPELQREEVRVAGGSRDIDRLDELGYPSKEVTIPLVLQTAILLHKVLGACTTVGTDTAETGMTVASGGGTATITISGKSWDTNEWAGYYCEVTAGDNNGDKYHILSNTANTLTFDVTTDANLDADTVKIVGAPFTHTITGADLLETIALHYENENTTDAQSIRRDLLGVVCKAISVIIEKGANAVQDLTIEVAKAVAGSDIAKPAQFTDAVMRWGNNVTTFSLAYNSGDLLLGKECDRVKIDIENEIDARHPIDDDNVLVYDAGVRNYTITLKIYPQTKTLRDLRNTALTSYATVMSFTCKIQRSATDYIQFTFSNVYVAEYPQNIPSSQSKIIGLEMQLRNAPAYTSVDTVSNSRGSLTIEAKDNKGLVYYEGTQKA